MISKHEKTYLPVENYRDLSEYGAKYSYHEWIEKIERHTQDLDIEAKALYDMVTEQVLPLGIKYQIELTQTISEDKNISKEDISLSKDLLIGLTMILSSIKSDIIKLKDIAVCKNNTETDHLKDLQAKINILKDDIDKLDSLLLYKIN